MRRILSNGLTRAVAYRLVCSYAKLELLGGVTTIRTVGGLADFDTRCRDDAAKGKILAPRILAANEGISVPAGTWQARWRWRPTTMPKRWPSSAGR